MLPRSTRRQFAQQSGLLAAGYWLGTAASSRAQLSPNEKLNLAVIGLGGQGGANLNAVGKQNVVALCDLDDTRAGKAYETHPRAKKFVDFRKLFDELEKRIDAVVISTPDHTHFHPAWWAMQRGKHVYLEKPLAHSVWEIRTLTDLAKAKKLATQLGAQRHTMDGLRNSVELIKSGAIGTVRECHSWIASNRGMPKSPVGNETPPADLNWDLWLGPAAERPYSKEYVPYNWRFWWDFGTGEAGNWSCHILDIPFWALDLTYPTRVSGSGPAPDEQKTPTQMATQLEFPATDKRAAVTLHWHQGVPAIVAEKGLKPNGMNNLFIGSEGMLLCGFGRYLLLPEEKFRDHPKPGKMFTKSPGFHQEWFNACRGGEPATCNFAYSGPMAESALLANVAYRVQGSFGWDAAAIKPQGSVAAEVLIRTPFRKGWEV